MSDRDQFISEHMSYGFTRSEAEQKWETKPAGSYRATGWEKQRAYDLDKIEQQENSREQI